MKINEIIQIKRKALNMTQLQLAEKLNVTDKTVSRWELGTVYPNIDMIPKIASVLHVSINELFGVNVNDDDDNIAYVNEKYDYKRISILKAFLYVLVSCPIISLFLYLNANNLSNQLETVEIIKTISIILFLLVSIIFFINRTIFKIFYKRKFYIDEYKYHDGKMTTIAIYINSFMLGGVFFFSSNFLYGGVMVFMIASLINFLFLKKLNYNLKKISLLPLIFTIITFFCTIILVYFQNDMSILSFMFLHFILNSLACFTLSTFIKIT